jgi:hypothetical protein
VILLLAAGCVDDVPEGSHLERTRVLAVRAYPTADPTRAWPRPGEETTISWLVASPGETPPLRWEVELCAGACETRTGEGPPSITVVAPDVEKLAITGRLLPAGEPATDLVFDLFVERDAPNHHPRLAAITGTTACVAPGAEVELGAITTAADREPFGSDRESLRLSFFTNAGELERQFAVVEADDPRDPAEETVTFTAPETEGDVTYVVVVRDLRGGVDFSSGTLCVRR